MSNKKVNENNHEINNNLEEYHIINIINNDQININNQNYNNEIKTDIEDNDKVKIKAKIDNRLITNKEINLDYSNTPYDRNNPEKAQKALILQQITEDNFTINNKPKKFSKAVKPNIGLKNKNKQKTNININNKQKNLRKNGKRDISADKRKGKKDNSLIIDIKNLIKEDVREKSMLAPSQRYKNIKKKKNVEEVQYYKPFKFHLTEDY